MATSSGQSHGACAGRDSAACRTVSLLSCLSGSASSSLSLGWNELFLGWSLLGTLDQLPGSVGILLALGPLAVAGVWLYLLARRDRLVLALAAGAGLLLVLTRAVLELRSLTR